MSFVSDVESLEPFSVSVKMVSPVLMLFQANAIPGSTSVVPEELKKSVLGEVAALGIGEERPFGIEAERRHTIAG